MSQAQPHILVLGGGFGGLESAFYLRSKLNGHAKMTMISDQDHFLYKPNTIYVPFGLDPETLKIPLAKPTRRRNIAFVQARADEIDPNRKTVHAGGQSYDYDYLLVATGAGMREEEVPGLKEHAHTIWTPAAMLRLREGLQKMLAAAKAGNHQRVVFLVPPNNKCSGPLYEIVMMLDTWLSRNGVHDKVSITWTTFESGYIQAFGPRLNELVTGEFARRGVTGMKEQVVEQVEPGQVRFKGGLQVAYDLLISFPPYIASTPFPGLPQDDRGFLKTDLGTRQVQGHPEIYAVGDAGDFPVKQAFLAFLEADAAAEHLSATILGREPEKAFDPVSMCVMEQYDKATFAQVPLRLTGDPARPIEVRPDAGARYRVGSNTLWRLGKKLLSIYLPWRFNAGNPFHSGLPWKGMEVGLKVMSKVMAS